MGVVEKVQLDLSGIDGVVRGSKQRTMARKAVGRMARVLSPKVRSLAPKRPGSGALKQAQGVKVGNGRRSKTGAYAVQGSRVKVRKVVRLPGRRKPVTVIPAFYDHLVESGTRPHSLAAGAKLGGVRKRKKKPALQIARVGQESGRQHPGARAVKFRERAWNANKAGVMAEGRKVLAVESQKAIAKESARLLGKLKTAF